MTKNDKDQGWIGWSLIWVAVCFFCLWLLDFPKPYIDDLFYCGGALNLANGGGPSNPFIAGQNFPNSFFVYPPMESYVLAGWLRIFGISALSVTAFPVSMYALISVLTIFILRNHDSSKWVEWLVPPAVCAAFLRTGGLRPEPMAIAMMMASIVIFDRQRMGKSAVFLGYLLMFASVSAAPRMLPFCLVPLWLSSKKLRANSSNQGLPAATIMLLASVAFAVTALLFLSMIHFQVADFLETFRMHSARAHVGIVTMIRFVRMTFVDVIGVLSWPLLTLPFLLFIACRGQVWDGLKSLATVVGLVFLAAWFFGFIGPGSIWFAILVSLLLAGSLFKYISGGRFFGLNAAVLLALIIANAKSSMEVAGALSGRLKHDQGPQRVAALALQSNPGHRVVVDVDQARYLFGYRIPAGVVSYEYASPFPKTYAFEELRKGDIYLLGPVAVDLLKERTRLDLPTPEKWKPIGMRRWWLNEYPRWVYVIPSEDCKELRAQK